MKTKRTGSTKQVNKVTKANLSLPYVDPPKAYISLNDQLERVAAGLTFLSALVHKEQDSEFWQTATPVLNETIGTFAEIHEALTETPILNKKHPDAQAMYVAIGEIEEATTKRLRSVS
jgi:hypothetical protein